VHVPDSPNCDLGLLRAASTGTPQSEAFVCWGLRLTGDEETKAEAHLPERAFDPMDPVTQSSCYRYASPQPPPAEHPGDAPLVWAHGERLFSAEELQRYGPHRALSHQILLAVLGEVFDVTRGKTHYRMNASYSTLAGRDASRTLVTGAFLEAEPNDNLEGLTPAQVHEVYRWMLFYRKSYIPVGRAVGRYFNANGEPTAERLDVLETVSQYEDAVAGSEVLREIGESAGS